MALLSLKQATLRYGGLPLLDAVEFHVERGERICLLGVNGCGKSSLLRVLAGEEKPDSGEVIRASGVRVSRLPQQVPTHLRGRVEEVVCPDSRRMTDDRPGHEVGQILSRLHLDPQAEFSTLSGGTRRRVLLARALLGEPDVVLLDEPTNHLDLDSIDWLESFLLRYCRTFLFVTHDRAFLRRLATRVIELDRGRLIDWACDYDTFLRRKEEFLAAEEAQRHQSDRRLDKEEAWLRRGVKARAVRNQGRVRALMALRAERRQRRELGGSVQMSIQESERTGQIVLKAEQVSFGYSERPLIRSFSAVLTRGDKVGILGPNGCGKTTLLNLLLGAAAGMNDATPRSGRVVPGSNLKVAFADQLRARLDENRSLADNIAQGQEFVVLNGVKRHIVGYLQDFLFEPERIRQPVSVLSGGERNRLLLAQLFAQPSNVLVLDEPTNDLDLDTLELLEEQLVAYTGTILVVSHDRAFLNNVVTHVWAFEKFQPEHPGEWLGPDAGWSVNEYVGGYDDWLARRPAPPEPAPAVKAPPPRRERVRPPKPRLSKAELQELEDLPGRIEALEAEQTRDHARMADPAFYRQDGAEIARVRERAEALVAELEAAYRRWEELEAQRMG